MREMHAMIGGNRRLLLQYSTETVAAMDGEADVVITNATEVVLTNNDEEDSQVFLDENSSYEGAIPVSGRASALTLVTPTSSLAPETFPRQTTHSSACN